MSTVQEVTPSRMNIRALVVDDDESQQVLIGKLLGKLGIVDVRHESDPARILAGVGDLDPDLIVLDIHLGDQDGLEILDQLVRQPGSNACRRTLVVTGDTNPTTANRLRELGSPRVLHKPYTIDQFSVAIESVLRTGGDPSGMPCRCQDHHVVPVDPERPEVAPRSQDAADVGGGAGGVEVRLVDVIRQLASTNTLADVIRVTRTAARKLTGADGATFILRDGEQCHYVDEDAISPLWKGKRFPVSACISGWVMLHEEPAAIPDISADDRIPHDAYRSTFVRSLVMVPIRTDNPIGAIGNYWATPHTPTSHELWLLQTLADSTALAIEKARLYEQVEAARNRDSELISANEQLREFVYSIAHDVRSPLSTIQGFADLLQGDPALQAGDTREAVHAISAAASNLADYVSDLLAFAIADGGTLNAQMLAMSELVEEVTDRLAQPIRERGARVVLEQETRLVADRALLSQALQNLVGNAIAYVPNDRKPIVRISAHANDMGWELTVSDNGLGVPPAERQFIFDAFRRGTTSQNRPGTGLGLSLCRRVAERHGGEIVVREGPAGGAEFVVNLSRSP